MASTIVARDRPQALLKFLADHLEDLNANSPVIGLIRSQTDELKGLDFDGKHRDRGWRCLETFFASEAIYPVTMPLM